MEKAIIFGAGVVVGAVVAAKLLDHKPVEVVYAAKAKISNVVNPKYSEVEEFEEEEKEEK